MLLITILICMHTFKWRGGEARSGMFLIIGSGALLWMQARLVHAVHVVHVVHMVHAAHVVHLVHVVHVVHAVHAVHMVHAVHAVYVVYAVHGVHEVHVVLCVLGRPSTGLSVPPHFPPTPHPRP